jgi:predicted secreted protein
MRRVLVAAAAAALMLLQACAPISRVIDTPKDGTEVSLSVDQGMQVRWSNLSPDEGTWIVESAPASAVKMVKKTEQPAVGSGIALDIFDFAAVRPGAEQVTFVYKHKDGSPSSPEERVSVQVTVG